jgi:hypothetical protein
VNKLTHPTAAIFDIQLASAFMGVSALLAGAQVTARRAAEEKQR